MSTAIATVTDAPRRSLLTEMATRYGMEPKAFSDTLRATVVPKEASNEEFAAFLLVAREYDLNPVLKEIYAFPKKGGGIQPIVSIDGWTNMINSHPQLDGIEFDDHMEGGKVTAITARLWRKDRSKPIVVTEYLVECIRNTDPWKQWPRRMLRHKALIQCARYAFGFAGIVDPDEAERMGADVSAMRAVNDEPPAPPPQVAHQPTPLAGEIIEPKAAQPAPVERTMADLVDDGYQRGKSEPQKATRPDPTTDPESFFKWIEAEMAPIQTYQEAETHWNDKIAPLVENLFPPDQEHALGIWRKHENRLSP